MNEQRVQNNGNANDDFILQQLGYKPVFERKFNLFASFSLQYSLIMVGGALFLQFNYGLTYAGPAFLWAWIIGGLLQVSVGLSTAELASAYPLAGSLYNWGKLLANGKDISPLLHMSQPRQLQTTA